MDLCSDDVGVSSLGPSNVATPSGSTSLFGLGEASAIVGGIESPSFNCILDPGGESGSSGRSSRKRDFVRFGTPELTRRGVKVIGGVGTCN